MRLSMPAACILVCAALFAGACGDGTPSEPAPVVVTGAWVGTSASDPASTYRFDLTQSDSVVRGTWTERHADSVVVKPDSVHGYVRGDSVVLGFRIDRYANGCVGALRDCYDLPLRYLGVVKASGEIQGHMYGPPLPGVPDSVVFASVPLLILHK